MTAMEMHRFSESFAKPSLAQHLMLVDGNSQQRSVIADLLKIKLHYTITEMNTGNDASNYFKTKSPEVDLILLDLSTVDKGFEFLSDFRRLVPQVPVVVLVQYGDYQSAADALLVGAQDFLTKPVAEARMGVTLRNCIQLRNAKRDATRALVAQNLGNVAMPVSNGAETIISLLNPNGDARKIEEIETAVIRFAIRFYNGRMTEVARKLGIGRSTLYRKLEAIGDC